MSKVTKIVRTIVAGFAANTMPVHTNSATYLGETAREEVMYRVVSVFTDVAKAGHRVVVPMTPQEARAYAAWLVAEADHTDYMNEGRTEDTEPRAVHPDDL